jgi:hypothetical protein
VDKRVLVWILQGLQSFQDKAVMSPPLVRFIKQSAEKQRGYLAVMNCLMALGLQRDPQHVELLTDYLENQALRGKGSVIHKGAIRGLAATRCSAALEVLLRNTAPGMLPTGMILSPSTRGVLMSQIASCVTWEPFSTRARVFESLEAICLADPDYDARMGAGRGLAALADVGSTTRALNALERDAVNQDVGSVVSMQRSAAVVRSKRGGSGDGAAVEKAQGELKAVQARMDSLEALVNAKLSGKTEAETDALSAPTKSADAVKDNGTASQDKGESVTVVSSTEL